MSKHVREECGKLCISSNLSSKRGITPTIRVVRRQRRSPGGNHHLIAAKVKVFQK